MNASAGWICSRWLQDMPGFGARRSGTLAARWDDPVDLLDAAFNTPEREWKEVFGRLPFIRPDCDLIERQYQQWAAVGLLLVDYWSEQYPVRLRELADPPLSLFMRGNPELSCHFALAVVGTRTPSDYALTWTSRIVADLVGHNIVIVSGHAAGIDRCAHHAALKAGGATVAYLGVPHDKMARSSGALYQSISDKGLVISEYPDGIKVEPWMFPARNRLIAAHGQGTLVAEGKIKSGTMITARLSAEMSRDLFAIPGALGNPQAQGPNQLIQEGAGLVTKAEDILESFYGVQLPVRIHAGNLEQQLTLQPDLPDELASLYSHIRDHPGLCPDDLSDQLKVPVSSVLQMLLQLELKDVVSQQPGNRYHCHGIN